MRHLLTLFALLTILTLFSCSSRDNYRDVAYSLTDEQVLITKETASEELEAQIERKIIKEGEIIFETEDVKATKFLIAKATEELGGYIAKDNIFDHQTRISHQLVIRVPANKFDQLLTKISESAKKIDSKSIDVLDITEEYIDIESRIKTKKELQNRYTELLKQANTVEEILKIEKEIGKLRTEIESIEGRLRYLKDRISLSTLIVQYYQQTTSVFGFRSKFVQAIVED